MDIECLEGFECSDLRESDIDNLVPVLEQWIVRDGEVVKEEVEGVVERMRNSLRIASEYRYLVVRDKDEVAVGIMGFRNPEEGMMQYTVSGVATAELVNAYLSNDYRGKGLGYCLMNNLFEKAKSLGFEHVIWNSGPRYKDSAWEFYTKAVGDPMAIAKNYYGEGRDAPVWRKVL